MREWSASGLANRFDALREKNGLLRPRPKTPAKRKSEREMAATLPSNIHAEVALDQGRLSRNGSERSGAQGVTHGYSGGMDLHARVQSLHGVIVETSHYTPGPNHGAIVEERVSVTMSGAELAAALDQEEADDDEYIGYRGAPHCVQGNGQHQWQADQQQRPFSPRQASFNNADTQQQQQQPSYGVDAPEYPRGILRNGNETVSPPPRLSIPSSAPAQQQQFPERPRFALTDAGAISAPPSPGVFHSEQGHGGLPAVRRAVSDSQPRSHSHSEPNSPGLGVTPPMHRGGPRTQPSTPSRYNTFEEMGIQVKNADKEKDCVIM